MYCKYCGHLIADDSKYCQFCGKSIYNSNKPPFINTDRIIAWVKPNSKLKRILYGMLLIALCYFLYYCNCANTMIVGEWRNEVIMGTEVEKYNSDGTWTSYEIFSPDFPSDQHTTIPLKGNWVISGDKLKKTFIDPYSGRKLSDEYTIVKLSSDSLILESENYNKYSYFRYK